VNSRRGKENTRKKSLAVRDLNYLLKGVPPEIPELRKRISFESQGGACLYTPREGGRRENWGEGGPLLGSFPVRFLGGHAKEGVEKRRGNSNKSGGREKRVKEGRDYQKDFG